MVQKLARASLAVSSKTSSDIACRAVRLEAGVADDSPQLFFRGAIRGAGGLHYIFFEHHTAHVVASEVEAQLQHLQSLRHPTGLHVLNVVEKEPRDGEDLQIFD